MGGGPGGLYAAILLKRADPTRRVAVAERNRADDTFGFGVVFSDATLAEIEAADPVTYGAIARHFVRWDDIDVHYRGEVLSSTGHGFAGMSRHRLLRVLQERAAELGVEVAYEREVADPERWAAEHDLVVAADGANSTVRERWRDRFEPEVDVRPNRFVWLGTTRPFPAFTFHFKEDVHGLWRVHAYQYAEVDGEARSTFIVETTEATWRAAGLGEDDEEATRAFCERLFADELDGHALVTNRSVWRRFPTVRCRRWSADNVVLLGDAAHTAHFSVGSGTKLAMEDAVALADLLIQGGNLDEILASYELVRRPEVESLQRAAKASLEWFEGADRYRDMEPEQFVFSLLTRSQRVTYNNLRLRDPAYMAAVDRWYAASDH
ncbi:MAG: FAD-dependent monooxygenase, partial [Gemmatimonadetes bacterium]|nr:FAD-dependent monooxygenase [Gemmatimonadota bacterium]